MGTLGISLICIGGLILLTIIVLFIAKKKKERVVSIDNNSFVKLVPLTNEILIKYSKEKYSSFYAYSYKDFLLLMIEKNKSCDKVQEYKEFNYPISKWVSKHAIDPIIDTPRWFKWIDGFERDEKIFALNKPACFVREEADKKIREFVKKLEDAGSLVDANEMEELSESIFIRASIDNFVFMHNPKLK